MKITDVIVHPLQADHGHLTWTAQEPFARLRFDCAPGMAPAKAAELTCVSDVADETGSVPSSCSVTLAGH